MGETRGPGAGGGGGGGGDHQEPSLIDVLAGKTGGQRDRQENGKQFSWVH